MPKFNEYVPKSMSPPPSNAHSHRRIQNEAVNGGMDNIDSNASPIYERNGNSGRNIDSTASPIYDRNSNGGRIPLDLRRYSAQHQHAMEDNNGSPGMDPRRGRGFGLASLDPTSLLDFDVRRRTGNAFVFI